VSVVVGGDSRVTEEHAVGDAYSGNTAAWQRRFSTVEVDVGPYWCVLAEFTWRSLQATWNRFSIYSLLTVTTSTSFNCVKLLFIAQLIGNKKLHLHHMYYCY